MPTDKEREILERQKLLAARLKPATNNNNNNSKNNVNPKSTKVMPKKAPVHKRPAGNKNVIDLTKCSKKESSNNVMSNKKPVPQQQQQQQQQKRPTIKRPSTVKTASAILAAARAKASGGDSTATKSTTTSSKSQPKPPPSRPSASATATKKSSDASLKQLPTLKRKPSALSSTAPATSTTSSIAKSSLANLVKHAAAGTNNDDSAIENSLKVHQPDDFWKNLRDWDLPSHVYHDMQQQQNASKDDSNDQSNEQTPFARKPIPNTFLNARHYVAAWAPLCMIECRAQLVQELMQNITEPILVDVESTNSRIRNRNNNNDYGSNDAPWLEENETGGHVKIHPKHRGDNMISFMPNDLILLIKTRYRNILQDISRGNAMPPNGNDPNSIKAFAGISLIGHTETARRELNGLIIKVSKRLWAKIGEKEMYLIKIGSNVTSLREFTALCSVDTLPMKQFLLGQHLEKIENRRKLSRNQTTEQLLDQIGGEKLGEGFLTYARKKFNQSQLTAIAAAAHEYGEGGFTLIKGPPGTGKTTTLCAVLNSLHIRQYNKYYDEVRRIATKPTGSREHALAMARKAKPRLLICAPSNAAIDNIIIKIMEDGFVDGQGRRYNPSMIRVGVGQSGSVRDVSLENKVDSIFSENSDAQLLQSSIDGFRSELSRVSIEIANLRRRAHAIETASSWPLSKDWEVRVDEENFEQTGKAYFVNHKQKVTTYEIPPPPEPGETQFKTTSMPEYRAYVGRIVKLVEKYFTIKTHLEQCTLVKASLENGANQFEVRLNLEAHVLNNVHMVMTTLGSAGSRALESAERFEVIVVDEAAQSVEPASLSAMRLGSRHAVLVGDPQQLPATIFARAGRNTKYDRSLFQRLEEAGQPVYMLNEQYRMHPKISHFPRNIFYQGALLDGPNVTKPDYGNPMAAVIGCAVPALSPFMILDLDSKEERGGTSLSNLSEAKLAVYLYEQLRALSHGLSTKTKVAVITPYAQQCRLLRQSFADFLGPRFESLVEVNTVDAFQGREANIVIFSAVRAAGSKGIGFLSDVRRMNVALTRAKHFLFVIARCSSIVVNPYWFDLVQHARETKAVMQVPMIGSGATASFPQLTSWKLEQPTIATTDRSVMPDDPRKRRRC